MPFDAHVLHVCHETDAFMIDLLNGTQRLFTAAELSTNLKFPRSDLSDVRAGKPIKLYWVGRVTKIAAARGKEACHIQFEDGTTISLGMQAAERHLVHEGNPSSDTQLSATQECTLCCIAFGSAVSFSKHLLLCA